MAVRRSKIGWTDFSGGDLNFVIRGCVKGECECDVGCAKCYALAIQQRFGHGPESTTCYPEKLERLKTARFEERGVLFRRGSGSRPLAFPVDMGDLFHPLVPDGFILEAFSVMVARDDVDWQVLTKRADRMLGFSQRLTYSTASNRLALFKTVNVSPRIRYWPDNIWAMVSVSNQVLADERIPNLLQMQAKVRGVSLEPLLGQIDISAYMPHPNRKSLDWDKIPGNGDGFTYPFTGIDYVICGAESGNHRRLFNVDWARSLRDQCQVAGVPFLYKQGSHRFPGRNRLLDGKTWDEFPRSTR